MTRCDVCEEGLPALAQGPVGRAGDRVAWGVPGSWTGLPSGLGITHGRVAVTDLLQHACGGSGTGPWAELVLRPGVEDCSSIVVPAVRVSWLLPALLMAGVVVAGVVVAGVG
ncbi:hypothetical protein GCM10010246_14440 [Streptomyces cuspidosporus]|uniref:Uncharacterized protein n=1 Tax=Streptomyces cuspidosporus TaxID=66882 RepID=A0ABP5SIU8_9ACTN